jgi:hypothetical protein
MGKGGSRFGNADSKSSVHFAVAVEGDQFRYSNIIFRSTLTLRKYARRDLDHDSTLHGCLLRKTKVFVESIEKMREI